MAASSEPSLGDPVKAATLLHLEEDEDLEQHLSSSTRSSVGSRGIRVQGLNDGLASVWSGGRVVGIGTAELKEEDIGQEKTLLTLHLIAAALLSNRLNPRFTDPADLRKTPTPTSPSPPTIYMVVPHSFQAIPILHALLAEKLSDSVAAVDLLKHVHLLQYFDFAGLAESVTEVSGGIFRRTQDGSKSDSVHAVSDIVLIQGLGLAISTVHRRSGLVQANALLAGLVRNIIQLSRVSRDVLVLVEAAVEVGLPEGGEARQRGATPKRYLTGIGLDSAFASPICECLRLVCGSETLSRTLDVAFDTMVVVHDGFGRACDAARYRKTSARQIVEVVKDRVGDEASYWGLWSLDGH